MGRKNPEFDKPPGYEGFLNSKEMCAEWNCFKHLLLQFAKEGMPRVKVRGECYYDLQECQKWYATTGTQNPGWSKPKEAAELLTYDELCSLWHCDRKMIKKEIERGMPVKVIAKRSFFDLEKCQEWMEGGNRNHAKKVNPQPKIQV